MVANKRHKAPILGNIHDLMVNAATVPGRIKVGSVLLEHKQCYQELRKISNREDVATSLDKQKAGKVWRYNVKNLQTLLLCVSST
jgi:hypothetical protein